MAWFWWLLGLANAGTALLFAWDKLLARLGRRRVREATLLWVTFAGGCVGAWLAMRALRHKTQKGPFRRRALLVTVVNPLWLALWWRFLAT